MAVGTYFRCDSCQTVHYGEHPPTGWIGMTRIKGYSSDPDPTIPRSRVEVDDQHACSTACAQRLLMTLVTIPTATVVLQ